MTSTETNEATTDDDVTKSIFAQMARGEVVVEAVYENEHVFAFHDLAPQAPTHVLVIPKTPVRNALALGREHRDMAGELLLACGEVARILGLEQSGVRIVLNAGTDGGQTVPYLHAHVLGGRPLTWPPG